VRPFLLLQFPCASLTVHQVLFINSALPTSHCRSPAQDFGTGLVE